MAYRNRRPAEKCEVNMGLFDFLFKQKNKTVAYHNDG